MSEASDNYFARHAGLTLRGKGAYVNECGSPVDLKTVPGYSAFRKATIPEARRRINEDNQLNQERKKMDSRRIHW